MPSTKDVRNEVVNEELVKKTTEWFEEQQDITITLDIDISCSFTFWFIYRIYFTKAWYFMNSVLMNIKSSSINLKNIYWLLVTVYGYTLLAVLFMCKGVVKLANIF